MFIKAIVLGPPTLCKKQGGKNMKRAIAWFLTFALLIASLPLGIVAAEEAVATPASTESESLDYPVLLLDTETTADVDTDGGAYFQFTPEYTDVYSFSSYDSGCDPWCNLYDMQMNFLAGDDDNGEGVNFALTYLLEAGNTYIFKILWRGLAGGSYSMTMSFPVTLQATHSYTDEIITEATCTEAGLLSRVCEYCNDTVEESYFSSHSYDEGICTACGAAWFAAGECGESVVWHLNNQGVLTISGAGAMKDYSWGSSPFADYGDTIREIIIEEGIYNIADYAFTNCYLVESVAISDGVVWIGHSSFYNCHNLKSIEIPGSVTNIGDSTFASCTSLAEIVFAGNAPTIISSAFQDVTAEVFYPENNSWTEDVLLDYGGTLTWTPYYVAPEVVDSGSCGDNLTWSLDSNGLLTVSGTGDMYDYVWGESPFYYYPGITSVIVEDGVTSIGDCAFFVCYDLTTVTIPDSVTTIGDSAFSACYELTTVTIPDSVTTIGNSAFSACPSLLEIEVSEDNPHYSSDASGILFNKDKTVLICSPGGFEGAYSVPDSVTTIGDSAFSSCSGLTIVTIPDSVTTIGNEAFYNCDSLTSVTIPDSVTTIGNEAFYYCIRLTTIIIPDSVTTIGEKAFSESGLLKIQVSEDNAYYSSDAYGVLFNKDKTELICLPGGFEGAYSVPGSVTTIGDYAFSRCANLTTVTISDSVTTIGDYAFYWCESLASVTIPDSVTTIGDYAFSECFALTSVAISDSVTTIGDYAFYWCDSLVSVTISDSVATIGEAAFSECSSLLKIEVSEDNAYYSSDAYGVLFNKDKTELVCMPGGFEGAYSVPGSVTTIGDYAFSDCDNLTAMTISDSVTTIGNYAFYWCTSLASVTIPDSVTTIGDSAFEGCKSLTTVAIPDSVTTIGASAFFNCTSLTSVMIPDGVTTISGFAFGCCESLTTVAIPDSITTIGASAFYDCDSLTSVTIPDSVTTIGNYAFAHCNSLTNILFVGDAPDFGTEIFYYITTTAYYPARNETWTTNIMQDYGGTITWVAYENSGVSCTGMSLSLNGDIEVNFYMTLSDEVLADENTRMVFNAGGKAYEMALADALADTQDDGSVWYRFSCAMPAKGMNDTISAQIYGTDGAVGEVMTYSVAQYYTDICQQFDREEKAALFALIEAMLNYGAAAQDYFDYNTGNPANAAVNTAAPETVDASAFADSVTDTDALLDYAGMSLVLESNTSLRVFFRPVTGADISGYTFTVDGQTVTPVQRGNLWYVELSNIAAKELDEVHTFTAGDVTVECSALSYVNAVLNEADTLNENLVAVCKALYAYNEAANIYFSK